MSAEETIPLAPQSGYALPPPAKPKPIYPSGPDGVIQEQPKRHKKRVVINVPAGMENLNTSSHMFLKKAVELDVGESGKKYSLKNSEGQVVYTAIEDASTVTSNCCGSSRSFEILIRDLRSRDVIHLSRPCGCDWCLCPCYLKELKVYSPPGEFVGSIEQNWAVCTSQFIVKDKKGIIQLGINGEACSCFSCGGAEFQILSQDGSAEVGKMSKHWSELPEEDFTAADAKNFGIKFPTGLRIEMKAVMVGALFLIDL